jgi:hypothetical protein
MKERIRQRLIERESFLPFGSVRFDTKETSQDHQTEIQKMFETLKQKVEESKEADKDVPEDLVERAKAKTFIDAIASAQDKNLMTDIETDNEYMTAAEEDSDEDNEQLEIEIDTLKKDMV